MTPTVVRNPRPRIPAGWLVVARQSVRDRVAAGPGLGYDVPCRAPPDRVRGGDRSSVWSSSSPRSGRPCRDHVAACAVTLARPADDVWRVVSDVDDYPRRDRDRPAIARRVPRDLVAPGARPA